MKKQNFEIVVRLNASLGDHKPEEVVDRVLEVLTEAGNTEEAFSGMPFVVSYKELL